MSHRVYLYNVSTPGQAGDNDKMMMEWGYELPLLLQPLFIAGGSIGGNNYNTHTEPDNWGLYFDAKPGIENLKRFYAFLERQPGFITNQEAFTAARENLFRYIENLDQAYFHIDAWDVFNMDDQPHQEQAETLLAIIAHNNRVIGNAIENNDISLLLYKELQGASPAFNSFSELFNYEDYDYGWGHIWVDDENPEDVDFFEEDGKWGLKDTNGKTLLEPRFDELYGFSIDNVAVACLAGKFGYVNKLGKIVVPLMYDDAFDFERGRAIVKIGEKFGLINEKNATVIPFEFDDIEKLDDNGNLNVLKGNKWGVMDSDGKMVIAPEYDQKFVDAYSYYHSAINGEKKQPILNRYFKFIGEFPQAAIEGLGEGYILVNPYEGSKEHILFGNDGAVLEKGFDQLIRQTNFPNVLILQKGGKYGALGLRQQSVILPYEYDALADMLAYRDAKTTDLIFAQKGNTRGIFDGNAEHPYWHFPLNDYEDIIWLNENYFALKRAGLWAIASSPEEWLSDFEFDIVVKKSPVFGFAYALKGSQVFTVDNTGAYPADKSLVQDDVEDRYSSYYFDKHMLHLLKKYIRE